MEKGVDAPTGEKEDMADATWGEEGGYISHREHKKRMGPEVGTAPKSSIINPRCTGGGWVSPTRKRGVQPQKVVHKRMGCLSERETIHGIFEIKEAW